MLLIGRHDFWPSYTPDVIDRMDADLWAHLAVQCDELVARREKEAREREQQLASARSRRR
ncbi:hypothetical protein M3D75_11665 [Microbacterium enclense]|uniref:hypothetical protein n=1 Tax=Microbacterium enclense TaxID=993073 RepID=UPI0021A38D60|nr:hypothetical protein [Microbacterium enclense]MCT2086774.1 hypothetical protein [Microbacterium enclense]